MTRSTRRTPLRPAVVSAVGLVLAAAGLVAPAPVRAESTATSATTAAAASTSSAGPRDDTARRWAGYRIPRNGHADGGWVGGYRLGRTPVFVTTPGRRPNRAGFRGARAIDNLRGRKGATRRETVRAAWILSKYGGYRDATQAAAVDAAVLHLLAGGRWRIGERRGAARIRATGDARTVKRFANVMLRQSRVSAGAYHATVVADGADVGGVTSVTVKVTDGRGGPVSGLPVTVTSPDSGPSVPVAGPIDAVTGDDGRAVVRLAAPLAGWRTVTARVGQVPERRLLVHAPDRKRQAAVAEGGVRRTLVASTQAAVRGPQSLRVAAKPDLLTLGDAAAVSSTVQGDGAARQATATLYGPAASDTAAGCSGASAGTVSAVVAANGTYDLPSVVPPAGGFYAWSVAVDGTATSMPVTACGALVKVRGRTAVSVSAPSSASLDDAVDAQVTLSGLPFGGPVEVTTTLYGPFTATPGASCAGQHQFRTQTRRVNGAFRSLSMQVVQPGWYLWQASVGNGDLWVGSTSACGTGGTLTYVNP